MNTERPTPETDDLQNKQSAWCFSNPIQARRDLHGHARRLERERDEAIDALHKCYSATGNEAGDIHDFLALRERGMHTVKRVQEIRDENDQLREQLRMANEDAVKAWSWVHHTELIGEDVATDFLAHRKRMKGAK